MFRSFKKRANLDPISSDPRKPATAPISTNRNTHVFTSFDEIMDAPMIDIQAMRSLAWTGIPMQYRARAWRIFLQYEPQTASLAPDMLKRKREDYLGFFEQLFSADSLTKWSKQQQAYHSQILRDLPRTTFASLRNEFIMKLQEHVLFIWAVHHPASGYVQGMNDILAPIIFVMLSESIPDIDYSQENLDLSYINFAELEADCYWCYSELLDRIRDHYIQNQPGIYRMLTMLNVIMSRVDPNLSKWIYSEGIQYFEFAFRWMNCLLVREFDPKHLFHIWDTYISNLPKLEENQVFLCAAMLEKFADQLIGLPHCDFLVKIQQLNRVEQWTDASIDEIIAQAYVFSKQYGDTSHLKASSLPNIEAPPSH